MKTQVKQKQDASFWSNPERGAVNLSSLLLFGLGFVFIGVGFEGFNIYMTAATAILDWTCTANASITDATFTGFTDMVGVSPLIVLVGFFAAGVFSMYLGIRIGSNSGTSRVDLGVLVILALGLIFLGIALYILPVTLEIICTILTGDGSGINSAFIGIKDFLLMSPLLLIIALIGGGVLIGFFGMKTFGNGG